MIQSRSERKPDVERPAESRQWRCGNASLELADSWRQNVIQAPLGCSKAKDEQNQRLVWITEAPLCLGYSGLGFSVAGRSLRQDGRRSVWSRTKEVLAPPPGGGVGGSDRSVGAER